MIPLKNAPAVVVIGGGLHGTCTALHLARAGANVTVVEKDYSGRHASGVNAGGVRTLGRHTAEIPLALKALEIWHDMPGEVGADCGFVEGGQIKVAESPAELESLQQRVTQLNQLGYTHEMLVGPEELHRLLPAAAPHCTGAIYCRNEGFADPYRTMRAYVGAARQAGVNFHTGTRATGLDRAGAQWNVATASERFQADIVVNAGGAWGAQLSAQLGEPVDMIQAGLMMTVTQRMPPFLTPSVGAAGRPLSLKQAHNGTVLIGGGYFGEVDPDRGALVRWDRLPANLRTAIDIFPALAQARIARCWAGIEGMVADHIPVIGRSRHDGIFHQFGFSSHGFELSPIVGKLVARALLGQVDEPLFAPFAIERFGGEGRKHVLF